jgi:polyhydroxyalkanoate synthesis regulator protein
MRRSEAIRINYVRSRYQPRAVLVDQNLELYSLDRLRRWRRKGIAFVVVDADTGQDITLILLA